ncbi:MAG: inositol monophosphatase family protein [Methylacidiphilales bacterium]|nr:inositol monophosphatase family protein [Candidatus Methylacidiphilales bacterium]
MTESFNNEALAEVAKKSCVSVGEVLRKIHSKLPEITEDFEDKINSKIHSIFVELLQKSYPSMSVYKEYEKNDGALELSWYIFAFDGVKNYIRYQYPYTISVAWKKNGVTQGVVLLEVFNNVLYYAIKGSGSYYEQRRIRCKQSVDKIHYTVGCDFESIKAFNLNNNKYTPRVFGNFQILYGLVAMSRVDALLIPLSNPLHDSLSLLILEAGGSIKTIKSPLNSVEYIIGGHFQAVDFLVSNQDILLRELL